MNIAGLTGADLDLAVAKAEGLSAGIEFLATNPPKGRVCWLYKDGRPDFSEPWSPSTNWAQGGPIIARGQIAVVASKGIDMAEPLEWHATVGAFAHYIDDSLPFSGSYGDNPCASSGPTPLIAAMRAYVASKEPA